MYDVVIEVVSRGIVLVLAYGFFCFSQRGYYACLDCSHREKDAFCRETLLVKCFKKNPKHTLLWNLYVGDRFLWEVVKKQVHGIEFSPSKLKKPISASSKFTQNRITIAYPFVYCRING